MGVFAKKQPEHGEAAEAPSVLPTTVGPPVQQVEVPQVQTAPAPAPPKPKSRGEARIDLKREQYALLHAELDEEVRDHYVDANDFGNKLLSLSATLKRVHETRDQEALAEVRSLVPLIQELAEAFRLSPILEALTQYLAVLEAEEALAGAAKKNGTT